MQDTTSQSKPRMCGAALIEMAEGKRMRLLEEIQSYSGGALFGFKPRANLKKPVSIQACASTVKSLKPYFAKQI